MTTNRQIRNILVSYVSKAVEGYDNFYQNFEGEDNPAYLQHFTDDLNKWVSDEIGVLDYQDIDIPAIAKRKSYADEGHYDKSLAYLGCSGKLSGVVGMYLGDLDAISDIVYRAYPEAEDRPEELAEAET